MTSTTRNLLRLADDLRACAKNDRPHEAVLTEAARMIEELRRALLRAMRAENLMQVSEIAEHMKSEAARIDVISGRAIESADGG